MTWNLCTMDWVAIGAIATGLMAIVTLYSLIQNRKQLTELKRQWDEQNKLRLFPSIVKKNGKSYLVLSNYSQVFASNIKLSVTKNSETKLDWFDRFQENLNRSILQLEPFSSKYMMFNYTNWAETIYDGHFVVSIMIDDKLYNTFTLNLSEFNVVEDLRTSGSNVESIVKDISHKLDQGVKIK